MKTPKTKGDILAERIEALSAYHGFTSMTDAINNILTDYRAPLPVLEKWAVEKQAFKDGKTIQVRHKNSDWTDFHHSSEPNFAGEEWQWRVKPEPEFIPLGQDDVPPGSAIRYKLATVKEPYWMIYSVDRDGMHVQTPRGCAYVEYSQAQDEMEITRDNGKTWTLCQKEKP